MVARRALLTSATAIATAPLVARAQRPAAIRLGILSNGLRRETRILDAFFQGLRKLGWVENDNLAVVVRDVEGRQERYPALAAELVALAPDLIHVVRSGSRRVVQARRGLCRSDRQGREARRPGGRARDAVELTVNLATAASIGLVVPPALLARADDVLR